MSQQVTVIDSIQHELFKVTFSDDHLFELSRRGWIFTRNIGGVDTMYMNHTRLIEAIGEMAI